MYGFLGVDNATSECDLDDYSEWDWIVENNKFNDCNEFINEIVNHVLSLWWYLFYILK